MIDNSDKSDAISILLNACDIHLGTDNTSLSFSSFFIQVSNSIKLFICLIIKSGREFLVLGLNMG
jgi:hypothetical protein